MIKKIAPFWKTVIAAVGGVASWGIFVIMSDSGRIQREEWALLITNLAVATGVFAKKNESS